MTSPAGRQEALPSKAPTALLLLATLTFCWGVNWPIMKIALADIEPWTFRAVSIGFSGALLMILAHAAGQSLRVPRDMLPALMGAAMLNVVGWHVFSAFGLSMIEAARAAIVAYTMPLWTTFLSALLLKERMTATRLSGLALGLLGLGLLAAPALTTAGDRLWGLLLMQAAALSWACGTVVQKAVRWRLPVLTLAAWQLVLGTVPVTVGALVAGRPSSLLTVDWDSALALVFTIVVAMTFGHYAWFKSVSLLPANLAAIGTMAIPIIGVLASGLILGEHLGLGELAAMLLVVGGLALVLLQWPGARRRGA